MSEILNMGGNKGKVLLVTLLLFVITVNGQKNQYKGWERFKSFSGRFGLSAAAIKGNESYNTINPKVGFALGGSTNFEFTHSLTLVTELNLEQKGTHYFNQDASINSLYITTPVLLRISLSKYRKYFDEAVRFFANIGPYAGYLIAAKEVGEFANLDTFYLLGSDIKKQFREFDAGLIIGTGFFLPFSRKTDFYFDIRYSIGLLPLKKNSQFKEMNRSLSLSLGFVRFFQAR